MSRKSLKLVREGKYAAEVAVDLVEEKDGWSPYLNPADAEKLDAVRQSLRKGDLALASSYGRVFELTLVTS